MEFFTRLLNLSHMAKIFMTPSGVFLPIVLYTYKNLYYASTIIFLFYLAQD